jgi:plastocyanin
LSLQFIAAKAPAHAVRAGAFIFRPGAARVRGRWAAARVWAALLAVALAGGGCDRVPGIGSDDGPRVLELTHDTIRLEGGVRLIDVEVRRTPQGDFDPAHIEARQGDVLRFTAADLAGHALVFVSPELGAAARSFLEDSGQLRSPPLITDGSSWVITLDGAPAGEYPFHCTTHDVRGRLTVTPRD